MAIDLKSTLSKVLGSKGQKKFYFAYGTGERKDKAADGELLVQAKKPKKPEVESLLTHIKDYFEGVCWTGVGADDTKTIYFLSKPKKLSPPIVSKMIITAKKVVGHQYDFQLPSEAEEARGEKLLHDEPADAAQSATTPPLTGDAAKQSPPDASQNAQQPSPITPTTDAAVAVDPLAAEYKHRIAALIKYSLEIVKTHPERTKAAKPELVNADALAKQHDYPGAMSALDEAERLLEGREQQQSAAPTTDAAQGAAAPSSAKTFADDLVKWGDTITNSKGPKGDAARKLRDEAATLAQNGELALALAKLAQSHDLVLIDEASVKTTAAAKNASASKAKVVVFNDAEDAEKQLQRAQKSVADLDFLVKDRKSDWEYTPKKRKERKDDVADLKMNKDLASNHLIATQKSYDEIIAARNNLLSLDAAKHQDDERTYRATAVNDRVTAAHAALTQRQRELDFAEHGVDAAVAARDKTQQALRDYFAQAVPNGSQMLQDMESTEAAIDSTRGEFADKHKVVAEFTALARGRDTENAAATLEAAEKKLEAAKKAVESCQGNPTELNKLKAVVAAREKDKDSAEIRHKAIAEALQGKDGTLLQLESDVITSVQQDQVALASAQGEEKVALAQSIKSKEAELARLADVRTRGQKLHAAGVTQATQEQNDAVEYQRQARLDLFTAKGTRTSLELEIPIAKEQRERLDSITSSIADENQKAAVQRRLVNEINGKLATATGKDKKALEKQFFDADLVLFRHEATARSWTEDLNNMQKRFYDEGEKKMGAQDLAKLMDARQTEKKAQQAVDYAATDLATKKQALTDKINQAMASERGDLDAARTKFEKSEKDAGQLNDQYMQEVGKDPKMQQMEMELAGANGDLNVAHKAQEHAEEGVIAAQLENAAAEFLQQAVKDTDQDIAAFAPFMHLKDADFEQALRGGGQATALNLFPARPEAPKAPDAKAQAAYEQALAKYNPEEAAVVEQLRVAQEAMQRLIKRDEALEQTQASFEDRKRAFGNLPPALLPPKFREELKAYREVEECFNREDEQERMANAVKGEMKNSILKDLGAAAKLALPVVEMFLDVSGIANNFIPVAPEVGTSATEAQKAAAETAEALKAKYEITRMVAEGIESFLTVREAMQAKKERDEDLEPTGDKEKDEEKAIRRKIRDDNETLEMLAYMKEFILLAAKQAMGAMSMAKAGISLAHNSGAADIMHTLGTAVPILGAVLSGIATAEAVYDAGKQIKMAHLENKIATAAKASGDEEALVKSYQNQAGRATNRAVKKSVHAGALGVQTAGSIVTATGITSAAGAATFAAGKGVEYGNKAAFKVIDWRQAAQAKKTWELAHAGSFEAMTEIFADHQKYATMLIVMRAVDGDAKAMKFCATRGLKEKMLDSPTSLALLTKELKVARQEMLKAVDQKDQQNTFGESVEETWETLVKGGKALQTLASKGADLMLVAADAYDDVVYAGAGKMVLGHVQKLVDDLKTKKEELQTPSVIPNEIKPMNAAGFASLMAHVETIAKKKDKKHPITEQDVQFRNHWLEHLKALIPILDKDGDWKEPTFKKEGGTTARQRINHVFIALKGLPETVTIATGEDNA